MTLRPGLPFVAYHLTSQFYHQQTCTVRQHAASLIYSYDYHAFVHENVAYSTTYNNLCCHFVQDYSSLSRNQPQNLVFLHVNYF